ncbi:RNA-binding S4 domain-containing protein [Pseudothermotoga thermarum]|uniref:RNA-binding S4 domain protein n=1 Tax=Pseudothermotoga thermarum DSM 5069 TaxID=688269 RepID=F7YYE4_9THEM|nr:S4 domain-containing protein [Pseudothermotoga thermarum]AEH50968.1 RNA-binding S4 domain protein [Pseudothermotoga thermarum DSM 5069]
MRIDKYLKNTRIIKRRTVAQEMINHSRVFVNDKPVKPSYEVKPGDRIKILFPFKTVEVMVVSENEYKLLSESRNDNIERE